MSLGSVADPLNDKCGVGGSGLYRAVPGPGTGEPKVAAVAGVRELGSGPGTNRLGESPSPEAEEPGTGNPGVDGVRPERGEGATGE